MNRILGFLCTAFFSLSFFFALNPAGAKAQTPTTVTIGTATLRSGVKHFGINLGTQNSWDSGQMLKNLVSRNPGFEAEIWQSILHCQLATATTCTDDNQWSVWPANFFAGASAEFIYGSANGQTTTVSSNTAASSSSAAGITISFPAMAKAPAAGDYVVVRMSVLGNPLGGWWTYAAAGATFATESVDLSPNTPGRQAIRVNASGASQIATVSSYFDSTTGQSFVQMNGPYLLSFRAKGTSGSMKMTVSVTRNPPAGGTYTLLSQTITLTSAWQDFSIPLTAVDSGTSGAAGLTFCFYGASGLLDDVSLAPVTTTPDNPTVFRDEVVSSLRKLSPGILRYMDSGTNWGSTIDNLLTPPFSRLRAGYNDYTTESDQMPVGLHEFLQLCATLHAEPWFTMPTGMNRQEMLNLIDYMGGSTATAYGARRAALGQSQPWTQVFPRIHLEFGNEVWNSANPGATMTVASAYGARAGVIFAAARSSASYDANVIDLVLDGWAVLPYWNQQVLAASSGYDTIDAAPYLFNSFKDASSTEAIYGPMFAQPEALDSVSSGAMFQQASTAAGAAKPARLSVYEVHLSTTAGTVNQAAVDSAVPSLGAGLAVADHMLLMLRDLGITDQNLFELTSFRSTFSNASISGETTPLWGSVVDMGNTNRVRPVFAAQALVNSALLPTMLAATQSGANPVWNQAASANDSISLTGAHDLQSFAFTDGSQNKLVLLNLHRTQALPVTFAGINAPLGNVTIETLTSANITDNNETAENVAVRSTSATLIPGQTLSLPPYSITVITSAAPVNTVKIGSVSCAATSLNPSGTTTCSATVTATGTATTRITWSATAGAITSAGAFTAPSTVPSSGSVTITATSVDFPTQAASTNVTITAPTAPAISHVVVSGITASSATLSWETAAPSTSGVSYGTTLRYGLVTPWSGTVSTRPLLTLTSLSPNTMYYAIVWSKNVSTGVTTQVTVTFTTAVQTAGTQKAPFKAI